MLHHQLHLQIPSSTTIMTSPSAEENPIEERLSAEATTTHRSNPILATLAQLLDCRGTSEQLCAIVHAIQPTNEQLAEAHTFLRDMAMNNFMECELNVAPSSEVIVQLWQQIAVVAPDVLQAIGAPKSSDPIVRLREEVANVKRLLLTVCTSMSEMIRRATEEKTCQFSPLSTSTTTSSALSGSRRRKAPSSHVTHISLESTVEKLKRLKQETSPIPQQESVVMSKVLSPSTHATTKAMSTSTIVPPITLSLPAQQSLAACIAPHIKPPKNRQRAPRNTNKAKNQLQQWQQFNNATVEMNNNQNGVTNNNETVTSSVFPQNNSAFGQQPGVFNPLAAFGVTNTDDPMFGQWLQLYYAMNLKNRMMANLANSQQTAPQLETPTAPTTTTPPPMNLSIDRSESPRTPKLEMKSAIDSDDLSRSASGNMMFDSDPLQFAADRAPYVCRADNCAKTFANKFLLKKHEFIHTGQRPHQCPYCPKKFNRKDNLLRHKKTHISNSINGQIGPVGGHRRRNHAATMINPVDTASIANVSSSAAPTHAFDISQFVQQSFGGQHKAELSTESPMQRLSNIVNGFQMAAAQQETNNFMKQEPGSYA